MSENLNANKCSGILKKSHRWKMGKDNDAFVVANNRCQKCDENESCLKQTFAEQTKRPEADFSTLNVYFNLKNKEPMVQNPQPAPETQTEIKKEETPAPQ